VISADNELGMETMANYLIIVESPTKARTIQKYVGGRFRVLASVGHIKDLPKSRLGVDIEKGFEPQYVIIRGKGKIIQQIKRASKEADEVFLAPDPDREGEAIAWHIAEEVRDSGKPIHRALFNDLSKETVLNSLKNPSPLDQKKVEAQIARRVLDRLVGYKISPILWRKVRRGLSAGRVQSVAVRLVCERQREIDSFKPKEYWTITARLQGSEPPPVEARVVQRGDSKLEVPNEGEALRIKGELEGQTFRVKSIETKEVKRSAPAPFTTSTLQQEAYRRLRFSPKKTMALAQQLYEGVELGEEGPVGLITYMRTDSVRVAPQALESVRSLILKRYGRELLPPRPNVYKSRKGAQEAHEAIRPTDVFRHPEQLEGLLPNDHLQLYRLIWERFVASQMRPAVYDRTVVEVEAGPYLLRASGSVLKFPGFTILYGQEVDGERGEEERAFPRLRQGEVLTLLEVVPRQHFTQPPQPYTEASLVKELEEKGIGRPSTYATILSNIQERGYVRSERGVLRPTELGFLVTDLLKSGFRRIIDVGFTADMEEKLDKIEEGELSRIQVLQSFYDSFKRELEGAERLLADLKREGMPTGISCEQCGSQMVIKVGRKGPFLSCSTYPKCTFSMPYVRDAEGQVVPRDPQRDVEDQSSPEGGHPVEPEIQPPPCPHCGGPMVLRDGRFGRFFGCSRWPDCRGTAHVSLGIGCPVEDCDGQIVERRSRRGRVFFSCNRYPSCRFATWDRPVARECPQCGASFMLERTKKASLPVVYCRSCGFEEAQEGKEAFEPKAAEES
jgi:DNA topoisomerase-1